MRWRLAIGLPLVAVSMASLALATLLIGYTVSMPDPLTLRTGTSGPVIRILARDGSVLSERGAAHDYIPIDLLPPHVINAVVATEDRRFWTHWGIDPWGMGRAFFANLRAGRFAEGGSTLTQQLAKNLFLTPERSLDRKLEELALALWLEFRLSKRDIMELYLNRVYFGGGAYGIEAAAQRYFDKSAREMTLAEAAVMAGLLKAPSRYAPSANPRLALQRGHSVLSKMVDAGLIRREEEGRARVARVKIVDRKRAETRSRADYAIDYVLDQLPQVLIEGQGEIVVDTTLDRDLQLRASEIVAAELVGIGRESAAGQAGAVVLDTEGGIRALVGGRSYAESQFNRAVRAKRQPGSAFKPFVYLAALERGFSAESVAYDLPFTLDGWSPKNDNGRYSGPVTLRHALAQSINTVAVRVMMDAGSDRVASLAQRFGIESKIRVDPSLALGTSEVSLLELTGAYGAFATGGRGIDPHIIRRIRSGTGRVLYARSAPKADQLASPAAIGELNSMLAAAVHSGTGKRAKIERHPVAGKTGTTQDFRDAWFIGYTAHLVGGVWVGNDNGAPMKKVTGGQLPAQIWQRIMVRAHEGRDPAPLAGIGGRFPHHDAGGNVLAEGDEQLTGPRELLPWQMPTTTSRKAAAPKRKRPSAEGPVGPKAEAEPPANGYPREGIDESFIARALSGLDDPAATGSAGVASAREASEPAGQGSVRPPPGMMSLGAATR